MARANYPHFLGVRIEPATRAALDEEARKSGCSVSDLVRSRLRDLAAVKSAA